MKVTLNIEQDEQLRAAIKDAIKGQVMSVTRDEISQIVRDEIGKKIANRDVQYMTRLLEISMRYVIENILYKDYDIPGWQNKWIEPTITKYLDSKVKEALKGKDWNKVIDDLAKQKIKELIK